MNGVLLSGVGTIMSITSLYFDQLLLLCYFSIPFSQVSLSYFLVMDGAGGVEEIQTASTQTGVAAARSKTAHGYAGSHF